MTALNRRRFLQLGSLSAGLTAAVPGLAFGTTHDTAAGADDRRVRLSGDGLGLSPAEYAALLHRLLDEKGIVPDSYSLGGVVEELEERCARVLGKERAIFMPTGTLANHLAVRALAGGSSRVIVQEESHLYQDEGDCAQTLSNLTLMPLAAGAPRSRPTTCSACWIRPRALAWSPASRRSRSRRPSGAGRESGSIPPSSEKSSPSRAATASASTSMAHGCSSNRPTPARAWPTTRRRSTPSTSRSTSISTRRPGAMLAGPRDLIDGMFHTRRMFGGGLNHAWPFALVALHYLDGFGDRFGRAVRVSEDWIRALRQDDRFTIDRVALGHEPLPAAGPRDRSGGVQEAARDARRAPLRAAARHVPDRRERNAEPHDGAGADRRLRPRRLPRA